VDIATVTLKTVVVFERRTMRSIWTSDKFTLRPARRRAAPLPRSTSKAVTRAIRNRLAALDALADRRHPGRS
jgi:hypothetical protein